MQFTPGPLKGLVIIEPKVFGDERGYFYESYHKEKFTEAGITEEFVQDNQSVSQKSILRGLHFQKPPFTQSKLVRVIQGEVYDVVVDLRPDSDTFGKWYGITLSGENKTMMYIPVGFAHGFCVTSETALFCYKCGSLYSAENEGGIIWNDPDVNISWPIDANSAVLSEKDKLLPRLADIKNTLHW